MHHNPVHYSIKSVNSEAIAHGAKGNKDAAASSRRRFIFFLIIRAVNNRYLYRSEYIIVKNINSGLYRYYSFISSSFIGSSFYDHFSRDLVLLGFIDLERSCYRELCDGDLEQVC